jgi:autotransporter-associated beta strand protein
MKTGTGVLEFIGQNTYQGNTLIHAGTLVVGGGGSLGTAGSRTGNVVVGSGAVLAGVGDVFPEVDRSIFVNPGGAIRGGSPVTNDLAQHTGTLTINSDVTIHSNGTDRGTIQFEFDRTAPSVGTASKIVLGPPFNLNLNPGASNQFAIDLVESGVADAPVIGETYTVTLATVDAAAQIRLNGVDLPNGVIPQSNYVLQSSTFTFDPGHSLFVETDGSGKHLRLSFAITPVPEPIMALALAAGSLGLGRVFRRRR